MMLLIESNLYQSNNELISHPKNPKNFLIKLDNVSRKDSSIFYELVPLTQILDRPYRFKGRVEAARSRIQDSGSSFA